MSQTFTVRLRGSSYSNPDGTDRQMLLAKLRGGDSLQLRAEPDNPHDRFAVAVLNSEGNQLGYLPSDAKDSSALLRGEPVSATVKKLIGGQRWWHKIFGIRRQFGLLMSVRKGPIDWEAHNKFREIAGHVDAIVKEALQFEKTSAPISAVIDKYNAAMNAVIQLNSDNPTAAAHRYTQAPINRLTMLLVKDNRFGAAVEAYDRWESVLDPVGLTKTDLDALIKRIAKARKENEI